MTDASAWRLSSAIPWPLRAGLDEERRHHVGCLRRPGEAMLGSEWLHKISPKSDMKYFNFAMIKISIILDLKNIHKS